MSTIIAELHNQLTTLKLSVCLAQHQSIAERMEKEGASHLDYLHELMLRECEQRHQKRLESLLKSAHLPRNKLLSDFDLTRFPGFPASLVLSMASGDFIDRYENILIFGNPGTGKSHLSIALAREWCLMGRRVRFYTAANLVQCLLQAKAKLQLTQMIKQLDRYEILVIDDISYVPFDKSETDVLFTLLSERYETRSLLITSNLPFSGWDSIFKDQMTTHAAIDRLVHHAAILELNAPSYRAEHAKAKQTQGLKTTLKKTPKSEPPMA